MRYFLTLLLSTFTFLSVFAQNEVTINPNPVTKTGKKGETSSRDIAAKATLTNNTNKQRVFRWTRTEVTLPQGWRTAVCDVVCYPPATSTRLITLGAGESVSFDVHAYPGGSPGSPKADTAQVGTAEVHMSVVDTSDANIKVVGIYKITLEPTTSAGSLNTRDQVSLFPNPAVDFFSLENDSEVKLVELYSIVGRKVKTWVAAPGMRYDLSDLPRGMYLVQMISAQGRPIKTIKLLRKQP
jgi:hypothetical protein